MRILVDYGAGPRATPRAPQVSLHISAMGAENGLLAE